MRYLWLSFFFLYKEDCSEVAGKVTIDKTTYLGNYEKNEHITDDKTVIEHKYYVGDIIVTQRSDNTTDTFYLHKDHQGSVIATTNQQGEVVSQAMYDPFGKRTSVYLAAEFDVFTYSQPTDRGYTGHKMLSALDIIHMNGRIYDPTLGRFLQADPHIQAPMNSQNYNRYSYVLNNPMSYTDPSGYFFKSLFKAIGKNKWLSTIVSIGLTFACGPACGAAFNAAVTYAVTGSLKAAAIGAFASAISPSGMGPGAFLARGIIGGLSNRALGGNFGHGFISAGAGGAAGGIQNPWGRILASAVIGGTVSELTGGKFRNGALSAAFAAAVQAGFNGEFNKPTNSRDTVYADPDEATIGDGVVADKDFNLNVSEDGKLLSGTININCQSISSEACSGIATSMEQINQTVDGLTLEIDVQVSSALTSDITIHQGGVSGNGLHTVSDGFFGKSHDIKLRSGLGFGAQINSLTPAHELGHAIGLSHQWNTTNSLMSYSFNRTNAITSKQMQNLFEAYR